MTIDLAYIERVRHKLLAAGTNGVTFQNLFTSVRTVAHPADDLRTILNAWKARKWVDFFRVPIKNSPQYKHIWRATQLLIDEWADQQAAMHAIVFSPEPWVKGLSGKRTYGRAETDLELSSSESDRPQPDE